MESGYTIWSEDLYDMYICIHMFICIHMYNIVYICTIRRAQRDMSRASRGGGHKIAGGLDRGGRKIAGVRDGGGAESRSVARP